MTEHANEPAAIQARIERFVDELLAGVVIPTARRGEFRAEFVTHIEAEVRARLARGETTDAAIANAFARFGSMRAIRRAVARRHTIKPDDRPARLAAWFGALRLDLRLASRLIWKDRAFSATVVLTLALSIAANATIFTVVRSVLLRPLDLPDADRLVNVFDSYPKMGVDRSSGSASFYDDLRADREAFDEVAVYRTTTLTVSGGDRPERLAAMAVTPSFFTVTRVPAALGRVFTEQEGEPGQEAEVILSDRLWRRLFNGDERAIGRSLRLNGIPYEIVGVMPAGFGFLDPDVRLWTPLAFSAAQRSPEQRHSHGGRQMVARLANGVTIAQAQARIDAVNAREVDALPGIRKTLENAGFGSFVVPLQSDMVRSIRSGLYLLWGGALFVLVIGAVNITNLALVRASVRLRELAMRHVLGASRWRVARQLVTEALLLALAGGALGLGGGRWVLGFADALGLARLPRAPEIGVDLTVIGVVLGLAALAGLLVGLAPAAVASRAGLTVALRADGRTGTAGRGARRARRALVTAQVAIAVVLLVGAALLLTSFRRVMGVDPGFRPEGVLTAAVNPPRAAYPDEAAIRRFTDRALAAIRALPGVEAAGLASVIPYGAGYNSSVVMPAGYVPEPGESLIGPSQVEASPGYFAALGIPLVAGRPFDERDTADSPPVVIVDDWLARRFWPNQDPIGRQLVYGSDADGSRFTVVGVVGTIKDRDLADPEGGVGAFYFPFARITRPSATFVIRANRDPGAIVPDLRRVLAEIDPELPLFDVQAMADRVRTSVEPRRSAMVLALAFGMLALLLSALGIAGVLAYHVAQRTREIGIRLALGSTRREILMLVLGEGARVVGVGLLVGLGGVVAIRRLLEAQLFGVTALDPVVVPLAVLVLAAVAALACLLPAERAARIDPVAALSEP